MTKTLKPRTEATIFADLLEVATRPGYAHALAMFCFRDNVWGYAGQLSAQDLLDRHSPQQLIRSEIATLQGLMMRGTLDFSHPGPKAIQEMMDRSEELLEELHQAMMQPWFSAIEEIARSGDKSKDPFDNAASMREPIFYGGDAAYDFQYVELAGRKYRADDGWLQANKGFTIDASVQVGKYLQKHLSESLATTLRAMRHVHPDGWTMLPSFFFRVSDIIDATGLDQNIVLAVLNAFIDNDNPRNAAFTSIGDFNTASSHPILQKDDENYVIFQTYSLLEALYESPFYWMMTDKSYRGTATANRGRFTEDYTAERLTKVFGAENVLLNVKLVKGKETKGEIDVMVRYGTRIIVVQAKSKKLTIAARKGNDAAIKADFAGAVQDAYDQAKLCCDLLLDPEVSVHAGNSNEGFSPPKAVEVLLPICVVSDHYPALSFQARQYLKHDEIGVRIAPIVCDTFLIDVLCEILDTPLQLLSYLERRSNYNEQIMAGQELAILGYHLKSNLWVDPKTDMVSMHESMSVELDVAMMARRAGVPGRRVPKGILVEQKKGLIGRILGAIQHSDEPAKFDLGMMLLTLSGRTIDHLTKGMERIAREARSDKKAHDFTLAVAEASTGFTVHASYEPAIVAAPILRRHCENRKYLSRANSWFGIAIDPKTALPRASIELKGEWKKSEEMDHITAHMRPDPGPAAAPIDDKVTFESLIRPLGRNDRCWCGSGKKYKSCHLDADLRTKWQAR